MNSDNDLQAFCILRKVFASADGRTTYDDITRVIAIVVYCSGQFYVGSVV